MRKNHKIIFRLTTEDKNRLMKQAEKLQISLSSFIRKKIFK